MNDDRSQADGGAGSADSEGESGKAIESETGDGSETGGETSADGVLERLDEFPLVPGVVAGVASFVAGYVLFFLLVLTTGNVSFSNGVWSVVRTIAFLFYNALTVPTYVNATIGGVGSGGQFNGTTVDVTREQWTNAITGWRRVVQNGAEQTGTLQTNLPVPELVYFAVPVVALVAVGYVYADRTLASTDDANELTVRSLVGAGVLAVGFFLTVVVGTFLFVQASDPDGPAELVRHPARTKAVLAGIAYPLVAGGIGIALGQFVPTLRGSDTESKPDGNE